MRVGISTAPSAHWTGYLRSFAEGVRKCGDEPVLFVPSRRPPSCEAIAVWGWRRGSRFRAMGYNVLVLERGYVGDRFKWTSLGWNGLNGRATFPEPQHTRILPLQLQPWVQRTGYALIMGQVPGDMACQNVNLLRWYRGVAATLRTRGWEVRFRPHPNARHVKVPGVHVMAGPLMQDLAGAAFVVTWNSNSAVDAVVAGVPAVAMDEGSIAWKVASHSLTEPISMPDRTQWAAELAWRQWLPEELADGSAWNALKGCMPCN